MLTQRRLWLLGHILRLDKCRIRRKLFVCASTQGRRSVGGQRMRWNDLVLRDLRNCNLDGVWRILSEDRNEWRNQIWAATQELNFKKEEQEKYRKNEQKRCCEAKQTISEFALHCSFDGCGFTAVNHAGVVNHQRQKHGQSLNSQCQYCHQTFSQQGLHNHDRSF
ncbi:uncharacterized protein LOC134176248 [Corticium candelabrum]|uniref:uncharacterized protein LOC134176248 n=1 Tax=Corticium candelabrum TaxID=121492 RepID=UPI002E26F5BD|nr:uncharacterized protein LOC134176248 [Corticium candelabrum]